MEKVPQRVRYKGLFFSFTRYQFCLLGPSFDAIASSESRQSLAAEHDGFVKSGSPAVVSGEYPSFSLSIGPV